MNSTDIDRIPTESIMKRKKNENEEDQLSVLHDPYLGKKNRYQPLT